MRVDLSQDYERLGFKRQHVKVGRIYLEVYYGDRLRIWADPLRDILFQAKSVPASLGFLREFAEGVDAVTVRPWYTADMIGYVEELGWPVLAESGGLGTGYIEFDYDTPLESAIKSGEFRRVLRHVPLCKHKEVWEESKRLEGSCVCIMNYVYTATGTLAQLHKKLELAKPSFTEVLRGRIRYFPNWWWNADPEEMLEWFAENYGTKHWLYPAVVMYTVGRMLQELNWD